MNKVESLNAENPKQQKADKVGNLLEIIVFIAYVCIPISFIISFITFNTKLFTGTVGVFGLLFIISGMYQSSKLEKLEELE